jgi:putative aldouronate transport system substrate-binding protein
MPKNDATTQYESATEGIAEINDPVQDAYTIEKEKGDVNLVLYMIGEGTNDQDRAISEINEKMKEDINATIEIKNTPWADWNTKYELLFNSGENFDGCFTTSWANYDGLAKKGGFYPLVEEEVKVYLPNFSAQLFDEEHAYLWENSVLSDGGRYIIPQIYDWKASYVVIIRGDLREKYGIGEIKSIDDVWEYALAIGSNEPGLIPINAMGTEDKIANAFYISQNWTSILPGIFYDTAKDDGTLFTAFDSPEMVSWIIKMRELQEGGAISKSVMSSQVDSATNFSAGKSAVYFDGLGGPLNIYLEMNKTNPEFKVELYDFAPDSYKALSSPFDGGMSVYAESQNPLRTLMAFDLLMGVREYNDLLSLGIQGVHWNPAGDDKYELLSEGSANYVPYSVCPWGLNTNYMRVDVETPDFVGELRQKWASQIRPLSIDGFVIDDSAFKTEAANVLAIINAEWLAFTFGIMENPEQAVKALMERLNQAGYQKIFDEVQAQMKAYLGK